LGAAYLAGLGVGFWRDVVEIVAAPRQEQRFEPRMPRSQVEVLRERWTEALSRAKGWESTSPA